MNGESRLQLHPAVVAIGAVVLIVAGAAVTYLAMRGTASPTVTPAASGAGAMTARPPAADVTVTLSPDAIKRAGIEVQPVSVSSAASRVRVPGIVQPNAYRTTVITSLVGGRISRVSAELGQGVRRGQTLAEVYSPELAEAQTRYIASRAELDAHERELHRTEKLAEIGAASRQELERIHAEHTAATTQVQSNRSRLTLLGMTEAQVAKLGSGSTIAPTVSIPSPLDGVVTRREANTGMNVDPSAPLFTVADLSTVWVVGNLNEGDLGRVRVGSPVRVTTGAPAELTREGKVSYIDPQINVETRTAQLRAEIANPGRQLRLGMYIDIAVGEGGTETAVTVPRSALQIVGDRAIVYVANPAQTGQFSERVVDVGNTTNDSVAILSGLKAGETIVTKGSFAIRSEAERLGVRSSSPPQASAVRVIVSEKGFEPSRVALWAGVPARLTFVRTTDATCATEVAIPSLNIKRALPLNQPVEIEFTPAKPGDIAFACGMVMFSGTVVVQ